MPLDDAEFERIINFDCGEPVYTTGVIASLDPPQVQMPDGSIRRVDVASPWALKWVGQPVSVMTCKSATTPDNEYTEIEPAD